MNLAHKTRDLLQFHYTKLDQVAWSSGSGWDETCTCLTCRGWVLTSGLPPGTKSASSRNCWNCWRVLRACNHRELTFSGLDEICSDNANGWTDQKSIPQGSTNTSQIEKYFWGSEKYTQGCEGSILYNTTHWVRIVLDVYLLGFPSFAQQSSIFHCRWWICVENFRWFCVIKLPKARNLLIDQSSLEPSYRLEGCWEKSRKAWRWKTRALHELFEKQCQTITSWVRPSWMWWFLWPSRSSSVSGLELKIANGTARGFSVLHQTIPLGIIQIPASILDCYCTIWSPSTFNFSTVSRPFFFHRKHWRNL